MALASEQWSVRGLVMGPGTVYRVMDTTNPWNSHVRAEEGGPRAWGRGAWSGAEWDGERVIPIRLLIDTDSKADWLAAFRELAAAFRAVEDTTEVVEFRYEFEGQEFVLFGRPRMVEPEPELIGYGRSFVRCAFVALDPVHYSGDENSLTTGLPVTTGGLTVPFTVPLAITATTAAGRITVANNGTATTGLRLRVDGPVMQPSITLVTDAGLASLQVNLDLDSGQWLDIDTAQRTVYLNGLASRRGNTTVAGLGWPMLPPGGGEVAFDAATFDAEAMLTVKWRHAWH